MGRQTPRMRHRPANRRRALLGAFLIAIAGIASSYAGFVAIAEGMGSALAPILVAIGLGFNCLLFWTRRAFPTRD
jgi:hypothetical protein